jgi:hypothetical protein
MATGATFTLVTNDGRMDQMLLANSLLRDNINNIKKKKMQNQEQDTNPTLLDIERSHVLFVNAHFKPYVAIAMEYFKISANNVNLGSQVQMSIPQYGDFFADMVLNVQIATPQTSYAGTPSAGNAASVVLLKHCDYPGERLLDQTSFEVNSNPIDSYSSDTYVLHRQFRVGADKKHAWNLCMGQETPYTATAAQPDATGVTTAPLSARTKFSVFNGNQTYKRTQSDLNLWIPLLFWFNMDPRLAFPSVSVPYGQRFITFNLTQASNIYRAIINPQAASGDISSPSYANPQVSTFDLYINNLFVLPEVHDIFIDRVAFTLIRVHRRQVQNCNKASDSIHLVQLKWPIEVMWFGFQPTVNVTTNTNVSQANDQSAIVDPNMEDWHRYGKVTNTASVTNICGTSGSSTNKFNTKSQDGHIVNLNLLAHSVNLFSTFPAEFFNRYVPLKYGGSNYVTPTDPGLYMYSFSLYPGVYQPSGHFNASRARELYLNYTSNYITSNNTATFMVTAQCINFILITEGSCTLRYST